MDTSFFSSDPLAFATTDLTPLDVPSIEKLLEESDLKRKRLDRKAELARVSRERKKMRIEELEDQVVEIKMQLACEQKRTLAVQQQLCTKTFENVFEAVNKEEEYPIESVNDLQYVVRQKMQFDTLRLDFFKHLDPCLPLQFMQWLLSQTDNFYLDPDGLWNSLFAEVNSEQVQRLQNLRGEVNLPRDSIPKLKQAAANFGILLRQQASESSKMMDSFISILSPLQMVTFLQWVHRFGSVCIKINL